MIHKQLTPAKMKGAVFKRRCCQGDHPHCPEHQAGCRRNTEGMGGADLMRQLVAAGHSNPGDPITREPQQTETGDSVMNGLTSEAPHRLTQNDAASIVQEWQEYIAGAGAKP